MKNKTIRERLLSRTNTPQEIYLEELGKEMQRINAEREETSKWLNEKLEEYEKGIGIQGHIQG